MRNARFVKFLAVPALLCAMLLAGCSMTDYEIEKEGHTWRFVGLVDDSTALVSVALEQWGEEHDHHLMGWDDDFHWTKDVVLAVIIGVCSELDQGENVGVDTPAADDVAARRGQQQSAAAGAHGTCQQDGCADPAAHVRIEFGRFNIFCLDLPGVRVNFLKSDAKAFDEFPHCQNVADHRDIVQDDRFPRQRPAYRFEYAGGAIKFTDANGDYIIYGGKP